MNDMKASKSSSFATVGVFGRANAGKSTLINHLTEAKVSIVSSKPQTTRKRILAIQNFNDCQIVFCDTPGLHPVKNKLDAFMHREIISTVKGLDLGIYLVDLSDRKIDIDKQYLDQLLPTKKLAMILVLNKSDLCDQQDIESAVNQYKKVYPFCETYIISAKKKTATDQLVKALTKMAPAGPHQYDSSIYTTQSEREIVEETVREVALLEYRQEVPHSVAVQVEQFKERSNGKTYIEAVIYVEKEGHKKIIIGKSGKGIKKLGEIARERLNGLLERDIFLQLWIKVRPEWRKKDSMIRYMGYKKS